MGHRRCLNLDDETDTLLLQHARQDGKNNSLAARNLIRARVGNHRKIKTAIRAAILDANRGLAAARENFCKPGYLKDLAVVELAVRRIELAVG